MRRYRNWKRCLAAVGLGWLDIEIKNGPSRYREAAAEALHVQAYRPDHHFIIQPLQSCGNTQI